MRNLTAQFNIAVRSIKTGHRVATFSTNDLNHCRVWTRIIMESAEYRAAYIVVTDAQGDMVYEQRPITKEPMSEGVGLAAPPPYAAPPQYVPQGYAPSQLHQGYAPPPPPPPPAYAPPPQVASGYGSPPPRALPPKVLEGVIEEDPFKRSRW
jgi:hypothetical protein